MTTTRPHKTMMTMITATMTRTTGGVERLALCLLVTHTLFWSGELPSISPSVAAGVAPVKSEGAVLFSRAAHMYWCVCLCDDSGSTRSLQVLGFGVSISPTTSHGGDESSSRAEAAATTSTVLHFPSSIRSGYSQAPRTALYRFVERLICERHVTLALPLLVVWRRNKCSICRQRNSWKTLQLRTKRRTGNCSRC